MIRRPESIEIKRQSLSLTEPRWRWIASHAIDFDGLCWHTRAFCLTGRSFKDLLLYRIMETRSIPPSEVNPDTNANWNEQVTPEIGPHLVQCATGINRSCC